MTHNEFAQQVVAMQSTLYRVSASLLRQPCDREDAVQSAIELAWRKRASLRDESRLAPWLTRILINECYTILRQQKRVMPVEAVPEAPAAPGVDVDLHRFFSQLPDKLRLPMLLYYVEGHPVSQVASILRLPEGTIKSRLSRGRERMRQERLLEEAED